MELKEYFEQAELALAAYADLSNGTPGTAALKEAGMSGVQASEFAANWTVVDQYTGVSGVSATVFKEIETGKTFLAIRGTNNLGDITADYILAAGFPSSLNPQFIQLQSQISQWLAAGKLSSGFTIAGHSIGGYLAAAIGTAFSAESADVYTFNTPGLGSGYGNIFDAFRAAFGLSDTALIDGIINVRGTAGISLISGTGAQLSPPVFVETESSLNPFANHSIVGLADALAVYCLFAEMSPNLTIEDISGIIRADSYQADMALETTVQKLADIFIPDAPRIASGDREELYAAIQTLPTLKHDHPNLQINSLAGLSDSAIASLAEAQGESGLATRYALVNLNPFTVTGESGLYDRFNTNGELDICNETNQEGDLSSQYIEDRAKFLYYLAHPDATVSNFDPDINFVDNHLGISLVVGNGMYLDGADSQYLFSNLEGELLEGGSAVDHLYGMEGNDILKGYDDADYLEGGKDNDYLDGGAGDDTLVGGAGIDTYVISGHDRIIDTGHNNILFNGNLIAGAFKFNSSSGVYEFISDDGGYQLAFHSPGQLTLSAEDSITFVNQTSAAGFTDNDFGIKLLESPDLVYDWTFTAATLDYQAYPIKGGTQDGKQWYWYTYGDANTSDTKTFFEDAIPSLSLSGNSGDDYLYGLNRADKITGGSGNDMISGEWGWIEDDEYHNIPGPSEGDQLDGGIGTDLILGSRAGDTILGGEDNDFLSGLDGDDWLSGWTGNDDGEPFFDLLAMQEVTICSLS